MKANCLHFLQCRGDLMITSTPPDIFFKTVWGLLAVLLFLIIYYLINIGNNYIPDKKKLRISNSKLLPMISSMIIFYFLYRLFRRYSILSDTLFTLSISAILAYVLNPLVEILEKKYRTKRVYAVIIVYFIIAGILFILAFSVLPSIGKEFRKLALNFPDYINNISEYFTKLSYNYYSIVGEMPILKGIEDAILENISKIQTNIVGYFTKAMDSAINSFSKLVGLIVTPILTFYFILDKEYFKIKLINFIPKKYRVEVIDIVNEVDTSVSKFVRGRLIMAIVIGMATTIYLMILGVDFAVVIGVITMIGDVVPYIGPFMGFIPAFIFAYISSPIKALWVGIIFVLLQWAENNILGPNILGGSTGLHPLTILISIIIGGAIFGVLGMIFSVPLILVFRIFYQHFIDKYLNTPDEMQ